MYVGCSGEGQRVMGTFCSWAHASNMDEPLVADILI